MIKKIPVFILIAVVILLLIPSGCQSTGNGNSADSINEKLIRFHVIANSDSSDDQALKLRVRNEILNDIGPKLSCAKDKSESEAIIMSNIDEIKNAAQKEVAKSGKKYDVAVSLCTSSFPTKQYSNIVLPAGDYKALKVVLGSGEGKNWWCVMFPPLCFIDITRGITSEETEDELRTVLNSEEFDSILAGSSNERNTEAVKKPIEADSSKNIPDISRQSENIEVKFKSVEIFNTLLEKLRNLFGV